MSERDGHISVCYVCKGRGRGRGYQEVTEILLNKIVDF